MYKYKNYEKLSKYFNKLALSGKEMPHMTLISKLTGVSTSTISRFAKKRNYYSFPAMRATFNASLSVEKFNDYGFLKVIEKYKRRTFAVVTSLSTRVLGLHAVNRLNNLGFNVRYIEHKKGREVAFNGIEKNEVVLFISLTGESNWYSNLNKIENRAIILCTKKLHRKNKNQEYIIVEKFKPKDDLFFNKNKALINMLLWIDDAFNVLTIERKKTI